ncbi:uncharacterized protein K452DRAFT_55312 [Aplosporella prunicola CBS 121167]|uniref:Uncharacterized protein n=1 Tax=Aplosporella prunicola CBS 121167 TaxID=1176127 RepID=A0A6A6BAW7_9PEZI|nr:uncharacterized protein K452DRAFT_55312 [Aplosporella prunicola CBS 121167]KAF2140404.1 hypothetical protein K452DRAFT_55312 [Aplosporella prunicola CBS 121167]
MRALGLLLLGLGLAAPSSSSVSALSFPPHLSKRQSSSSASSPRCYYPNGLESSDIPCNAGASDGSPCCAKGYICFSNKLCVREGEGGRSYHRGSCTDQSWRGEGCPRFCLTSATALPTATAVIARATLSARRRAVRATVAAAAAAKETRSSRSRAAAS